MKNSKNKKDKDKKNKNLLTNEEIISLISIYYSEWEHRDDVLWRQVFKYYYVTLIVMVFPHITGYFNANFKIENPAIFYWVGLLMSIMFYYVSVATAMRTIASSKAYEKILNVLIKGDDTYSRVPVSSLTFGKNKDKKKSDEDEKKSGKLKIAEIFHYPLAIGIITAMFVSLVIIAVVLLQK